MNTTTGYAGTMPLRGRALAASIAVFAALLGPFAMAASTLTFGSSQDTDEARSGMALLAIGILLTVLLRPVAAICQAAWLARARANAGLFAPAADQRLAAGWAVAGWFLPVVSWFVPALMIGDVVRASDPAGSGLRAVAVWRTARVVGDLALLIGVFTLFSQGSSGVSMLAQALISAAASYLVAALALRSVAFTLAGWQDGRRPNQ